MALLYLVRHGETAHNAEGRWQGHADIALSPRGEQQAMALARRLAAERVAAIYCSDLERARRTAHVAGELLTITPVVDARLREVDVGSWSGWTAEDARERDADGYARWLAGGTGWTDGETYLEMAERVVRCAMEIAERHGADERVVFVCHGGPIRALVARSVGLEGDGRRALMPCRTGSISIVRVLPSGWRLDRYDDACHVHGAERDQSLPARD